MEDGNRRTNQQDRSNNQAVVRPSAELRLKSGEVRIFAPDIQSARIPMVSLGRLRDGLPVFHFRNYKRMHGGAYVITNEGASFTFAEFRKIVMLIDGLLEAAPELSNKEERV